MPQVLQTDHWEQCQPQHQRWWIVCLQWNHWIQPAWGRETNLSWKSIVNLYSICLDKYMIVYIYDVIYTQGFNLLGEGKAYVNGFRVSGQWISRTKYVFTRGTKLASSLTPLPPPTTPCFVKFPLATLISMTTYIPDPRCIPHTCSAQHPLTLPSPLSWLHHTWPETHQQKIVMISRKIFMLIVKILQIAEN